MRPLLTRAQLLEARSRPRPAGGRCDDAEIAAQLAALPGWRLHDGALERDFALRDYHDTLAFVNALAWVVHGEDHHPELVVSYDRCRVRWCTHSVGGVSENDFICAAKTDAVYGRGAA